MPGVWSDLREGSQITRPKFIHICTEYPLFASLGEEELSLGVFERCEGCKRCEGCERCEGFEVGTQF